MMMFIKFVRVVYVFPVVMKAYGCFNKTIYLLGIGCQSSLFMFTYLSLYIIYAFFYIAVTF